MKVILTEEQIKSIMLSQIREGMSYDEWLEANKDNLENLKGTFGKFSDNFKLFGGLENIWNKAKAAAGDVANGVKDAASGIVSKVGGGNWLNTVKGTFQDYKTKFNNQYNQTGTLGQDRADCSGFVFSALRNAGYNVGVGNTDTMVDSPAFTNAISGGFERINWNGPADASKLPAGTILAYKGSNGKSGHTLILGDNGKSYDYGKNRHTEYSPNLNKIYTVAWVPKA